MTRRVLLSWSSGKDSAWTLQVLRDQPDVEVVGLLTTLNETAARVAMHAVREDILRVQARRTGLALWPVLLPSPCPNETYQARMAAAMQRAQDARVAHIAFGDLALEDVRAYREAQFDGFDLEPLFPIWKQDTAALARRMVDAGIRAVVTCVDPKQLDPGFAGRSFDHAFLDALPAGVDPCGENGEFHTCVLDGPMYARPIDARVGEVVTRDGFVFADVVLDAARA